MLDNVEVCFFHIEKCGGMSLRHFLNEYFLNIYQIENIYYPNESNNLTNLVNIDNKNTIINTYSHDIKVLLLHCNYNEENITDVFSKKCFSITCIREPYSRMISHYYYFYYEIHKKHIHELSEAEFMSIYSQLVNIQILRLSGGTYSFEKCIENIKNINCILILEKFKTDIPYLLNILNKKYNKTIQLDLPIENKTHLNIKINYDKDMIFLKKYQFLFQEEINLYEYIRNMKLENRIKY